MHNSDTKNLLSIHIMLGASDFAKIKIATCPNVGQITTPFDAQTKMERAIMSSGRESDMVSALFNKTSINGYEKLCRTDVLD